MVCMRLLSDSAESGFNRVLFHFRSQEKRKEDVTHLEETATKSNLSVKVASSIGFSSASGKPVNISSKALDQAKKLFQDLDEKDTANDIAAQDFKVRHQGKAGLTPEAEQEVEASVQNLVKKPGQLSYPSSVGFSSAAGKNITISKEALAHAKKLFETEEQFNLLNIK